MRRLALVLILFCWPALLTAGQYSDLYVIPVAGHVTGADGSTWMSDVAIENIQSTPLTVQLVVIESGEGMPENVTPLATSIGSSITIPANGTRILRDVLNGHRGLPQTIGAILVGADRPFAVSSRAYNANAAGATQGQSVTPLRDFLDNTLATSDLSNATAYVAGLTSNSHYRTNLGFVAGSASSGLTLEVSLRGADGSTLGTRRFSVPPNGFEHVQFGSTSIASQTFDEASATYRILSGSGTVAPYASVVDALSGAAFFIGGQFPPNAPFPSSTTTFRMLFDRLRAAQ